mmetsp:Transcript_11125/g.29574  ORF Transcript_11125/g.29574 Transcript_11125/m.29574 type:complete len:306 (+) Transcript_11125:2139-3056(+)
MAVEVSYLASRVFFELGHAADAHDLLSIFGDPQGNGSAPVPAPRDAPIPGLAKPVVEAFLLHELRDPIRLVVVRDQRISRILNLDEPAGNGHVDDRSVRTPTVRVVVDLCPVVHQAALVLQLRLDVLVGFLDVLALEQGHIARKTAVLIHWVDQALALPRNDAKLLAHAVIVFAEGGRLVDDARSRLRRNIAVGDDVPRLLLNLALEEIKERLVLHANELFSFQFLEDLEVFFRVLLDALADPLPTVLPRDPLAAVFLPFHAQIRQLRVDAERHVRGQGPGRRRPRQKVGVRFVEDFELDDDGWV